MSPALCLLSGAAALFAVLQARRLALQLAQVEEPRALYLAAGDDLDLVDARRIERKDALHADAVAHLADGERGVHLAALLADDHALEDLDAFLVAFADLRVHPHGVADAELRDLRPRFRLHVPLLHQLDRLRTHFRNLFPRSRYRSPRNRVSSSAFEQIRPPRPGALQRLLAPPGRDL